MFFWKNDKGDKGDEFSRYKRLRQVGKGLNHSLVKLLGKQAINKGGKDLGILKRGTLIFDSEDEMSVLMDYCIYSHQVGKKTVIDRYLDTAQLEPVSDEMLLLKAMQDSYFSVFMMVSSEKKYLCHVKDIIRGRDLTLIDTGLAQTNIPGLPLASRVIQIPVSDKYMTTGATIPLVKDEALRRLEDIITKFAPAIDGTFSKTQEASFAKQVIRMALKTGNLERMNYADAKIPND